MERLEPWWQELRPLRARICAIGDAACGAVGARHLKVDLRGEEFVAESLVEAFRSIDLTAKRVLLPRAAVARDILPRKLRERGACVDVVEAYRTVVPEKLAKQAGDAFGSGRKPEWITFTRSST